MCAEIHVGQATAERPRAEKPTYAGYQSTNAGREGVVLKAWLKSRRRLVARQQVFLVQQELIVGGVAQGFVHQGPGPDVVLLPKMIVGGRVESG